MSLGHEWWPFEQARAWVHKLELWRYRPQGGGQVSWKEFCARRIPNLPPRPVSNIPTAPGDVYAKSGWKGFQDWVGRPAGKIDFRILFDSSPRPSPRSARRGRIILWRLTQGGTAFHCAYPGLFSFGLSALSICSPLTRLRQTSARQASAATN